MRVYETFLFSQKPDWSIVSVGKIDCFNWENADDPYRPNSTFQMCLVKHEGIFVRMKTDEKNIRSVCKGRDENCWEDSCMEFFFKPFSNRDEYMNFEMTPSGAYLSAVGASRDNRKFIKDITSTEPTVCANKNSDGWELTLQIPCKLISEVYKTEFIPAENEYTGNFYKCADKTQTPHFGSFSPMGEITKGFHNPELFAKINVKDVCTYGK